MGYEFCGFKWGKEKFVRDRDQPDHTLDIPQAKDGSREAKSRSIWRPTEIELFWSWPLLWVKGSIRRLRVRLQEPSNLACALHLAMFGAKFMKISPEGFGSDHRSKKKICLWCCIKRSYINDLIESIDGVCTGSQPQLTPIQLGWCTLYIQFTSLNSQTKYVFGLS